MTGNKLIPNNTYSIKSSAGLLVLGGETLDATLGHTILIQGGLQLPLKLVVVGLELLSPREEKKTVPSVRKCLFVKFLFK